MEANAAAMEATLDGYGQHECGEVVVMWDAEAATKVATKTTEAEAEAKTEEGAVAERKQQR